MNFGALQTMLAWAEDRALLRSNPSADPGAKTGAGAERDCSAPGSHAAHQPLRDWHRATNLRGTMPRHPGQDVVHHCANRPKFHFTVNQDSVTLWFMVLPHAPVPAGTRGTLCRKIHSRGPIAPKRSKNSICA